MKDIRKSKQKGIVYLVGAGPGDPGLITRKAESCLRRADVIIYDYLANKRFLSYAPPRAKKIYVGKRGASHTKDQERIHRLMIQESKKGKIVVRLKGGDPFVFGRGGEEAQALAAAAVSFEIVSGVTSAIAVPAYAGIPVTHRDVTSVVAFVTGHERDEEGNAPPDWVALSKIGTVIFLMGFGTLEKNMKKLIEAGRDPQTPVAVIEWGTLPQQKTAVGTLKTIVEETHRMKIRPPTITVVGQVVELRKDLAWFEKKRLFGKKILVTRSRGQASELSQKLEEEGARVFEMPTLEFRAPKDWKPVDRAVHRLSQKDWLVFTSANGVNFFFERLKFLKKDIRVLGRVLIAAIGPMTARVLKERGLEADLVASEFRTGGLLKTFKRRGIRGKKILLLRAHESHEDLPQGLLKMGAKVEEVEIYQQRIPRKNALPLARILSQDVPDLIVFASSNTVRNYMALAKMAGVEEHARKIPVASIGPMTTKTAKEIGLKVVAQPRRSTIPNLVEAIASQANLF